MILNAYAILDGSVTLLRMGLALLVVVLGVAAWRRRRATSSADGKVLEDRGYLLFLLALLLLFLNAASWPLLYLLLASYVPEWPGVMCVYGVTRVGAGSQGPSRFLPGLLQALQALKPLLVFASGAWVMLYLANRRTATSPLTGRLLVLLVGLGLLAGVDSAAEAAYLAIPKQEEFLSAGCCTAPAADPDRFLPASATGEDGRSWLAAAFYAVTGGMILGLFVLVQKMSKRQTPRGLAPLLLGALGALAVGGLFLVDVVAPALLRLPHHHCAYDLLTRAPESVLAVVSFLGGTFAVGWACVTAWFAACPETRPHLGGQVRGLLVLAFFGYLGSVVMVSVELSLV
jgi:hypothetical protein